MINYLCVIQARLDSTRLPNKVMQLVEGKTMLRRVWEAAKGAMVGKVVVAWPERYPDVDEDNVLERFRRISKEFPSHCIIRLTSDCPLLTSEDINKAIKEFVFRSTYDVYRNSLHYYSNHEDGHDVQIFTRAYLFDSRYTHREHVINDFSTPSTGLSVNTKEDLERVRKIISHADNSLV